MGGDFVHEDVSAELGLEEPFVVSIRSNMFKCLCAMLSISSEMPVLHAHELYNEETGERLYNELWTADGWLRLQARLLHAVARLTAAQLGLLSCVAQLVMLHAERLWQWLRAFGSGALE